PYARSSRGPNRRPLPASRRKFANNARVSAVARGSTGAGPRGSGGAPAWQASTSAASGAAVLRGKAPFERRPVGRRRAVVALDQVPSRLPHVPCPREVAAAAGVHPVHQGVDKHAAAVILPQF